MGSRQGRASFDAAVIGGGIIGTAAATFLARSGRSVVLFEREEVAAGASGRNSGVLQHPFDGPMATLHRRSLALYRELAGDEPEFSVEAQPAGLLMVGPDGPDLREAARLLAADHPDLRPEYVPADELRRNEPALAVGIGACRLATGHPVVPAAATRAYARAARRAGVDLRIGRAARPRLTGSRISGIVIDGGEHIDAAQVLVAAGPWSPTLVPAWADRPPIRPTYGVVVAVRLEDPPRQVLEEIGIDPASAEVPTSFSLVTADGVSSVGSTFMQERPDAAEMQQVLLEAGRRFVPALRGAPVVGVRSCARPVSYDGRPLIGAVRGLEGLFICAGHGPWGMSIGPASAELVTAVMTGDAATQVPAELGAERYAG
ncbi:MAG TPA: FAD-dependent oxidoreductase [Candidatus Limnocylindrales bacterium]|nr:FAD-dependent oxidoreductase [Candidatus Limnocylindrales bacterium]